MTSGVRAPRVESTAFRPVSCMFSSQTHSAVRGVNARRPAPEQMGGQPPHLRASITIVMNTTVDGDLQSGVPTGCEAARVARVDRGLLSVLTSSGERRVRIGGALHGGDAPAVGDWIAVRGELAIRLLPRRTAFVR